MTIASGGAIMDKFLIILIPKKLCLYRHSQKGMYEKFYISGEEYLQCDSHSFIKEIELVRREILDVCNLVELQEVSFDVIYHQVDTNIVKEISQAMLPCHSWQIFSFEKVLPEVLLKMKRIKPNESHVVSFKSINYQVLMNDKGFIAINKTDTPSEFKIELDDLALIFYSTYEFISNVQEIEKKELIISQLNSTRKQLSDENSILKSKLNRMSEEIAEKSEVVEKKESLIKKLKETNDKLYMPTHRKIIRAQIPARGGLASIYITNTYFTLEWVVDNGDMVKRNEVIANIKGNQGLQETLQSVCSGRIFFIIHHGERVKDGQVIAVISEPSDSIIDIRKWVNSFS